MKLWREVGVVPRLEMVNLDAYARIEGVDGRALVLYCDVDRLERHLLFSISARRMRG